MYRVELYPANSFKGTETEAYIGEREDGWYTCVRDESKAANFESHSEARYAAKYLERSPEFCDRFATRIVGTPGDVPADYELATDRDQQ